MSALPKPIIILSPKKPSHTHTHTHTKTYTMTGLHSPLSAGRHRDIHHTNQPSHFPPATTGLEGIGRLVIHFVLGLLLIFGSTALIIAAKTGFRTPSTG